MSHPILGLDPKNLWKNFYGLTQIPRPSGHEQQVVDWVVQFGKNLGLETFTDEVGNVIIRKPATPGMENRMGVVLQGHVDMVPQKNSDKVHDFTTDPIEPRIDGEWVKANGTTLGADNGIGVAAAMAVLESKDIPHGPVEALFTIDEETGMTGAFGLKAGDLKGDILINMDSEDEGELYVGCAGGTNANATFSFQAEKVPAGHIGCRISVTGLKGGHSGVDINLQRGNSNKILFRFLRHAAAEYGLRISAIQGGSLRNAIPRESFVTAALPEGHKAKFHTCLDEYAKTIQSELATVEDQIRITAEPVALPDWVMDNASAGRLMNAIYACPNGVIRMSDDMHGLVETSNNLAIVKTTDQNVFVQCLVRSSVDSGKKDLENMIEAVFQLAGAEIVFDGQYPGWKPNMNSRILKLMQEVYQKNWGKVPEIKAIHAGLECGLLGGVYPNWDMISFGPTIRYPHSPDEKVNIDTVRKFWEFLVETLKNVPVKG